jgi:serine/threonine protein kinase
VAFLPRSVARRVAQVAGQACPWQGSAQEVGRNPLETTLPLGARATDAEPQRIGKYELKARLGQGSSGAVWHAVDTFSGAEVALKVLDQSFFIGEGMDALSRQQFMNEASLAGQLQHPHIAAILEASIDEKSGYIAVEYVDGNNLSRATRPEGLLKIEDVIEIAFKCCGALDYAFRQGIIHRDLKPANLMVSGGTAIKIVDFGAALLANPAVTQIQDVGTPRYMSPEQVRGEPLSFQSDMFSLGVVLYELFTGTAAFPGDNVPEVFMRIVEVMPPPASTRRPELDPEVDRILSRMLAKNPGHRYPSWADLALDIAAIGHLSVFEKQIPDREKFLALRTVEALAVLNDAEVWELVHASQWNRIPAQTIIMREGESGTSLLFLAAGEVKVVKQGRLLNVLRNGSYLGEMAYVKQGGIPRQATVETSTDALIAEFRPAALKKLSTNCQLQISLSLLTTVVDRLAFADERIAHA